MTTSILRGSATALPLPRESVHCIFTSPPYNVGVPYEGYDDTRSWEWYVNELVRPSIMEMARVLVPGGRLWINVPTNAPYAVPGVLVGNGEPRDERMDVAYLWQAWAYNIGLQYRDTIIWRKGRHDGGTAWGSWLSPSAPNIRGEYESVLCFFKGPNWKRTKSAAASGSAEQGPRVALGGDWTDLTSNIWEIKPSHSKHGPAPFPIELPARAIRLSTWPGETVLDPFGGSGVTAQAADILGCHGISIDISDTQTRATHDRLTDIFS